MPLVSVLCSTHGRFKVLRDALACFLRQDYAAKELIILNHHPAPLWLADDYQGVVIINAPRADYRERHRLMLDAALGCFVHPWMDDDLYAPWCLSWAIRDIGKNAAYKVHPFWIHDPKRGARLGGTVAEGSFMFEREAAMNAPLTSVHGITMPDSAFVSKNYGNLSPYAMRWGLGLCQDQTLLGMSDRDRDEYWRAHNQDDGRAEALSPSDVTAALREIWPNIEEEKK